MIYHRSCEYECHRKLSCPPPPGRYTTLINIIKLNYETSPTRYCWVTYEWTKVTKEAKPSMVFIDKPQPQVQRFSPLPAGVVMKAAIILDRQHAKCSSMRSGSFIEKKSTPKLVLFVAFSGHQIDELPTATQNSVGRFGFEFSEWVCLRGLGCW